MNLKKSFIVVAFIAISLPAFGFQVSAQQKVLFEKAKFTMETKGDLEGAIELFEKIIVEYPEDRPVVAKALLHIGMCYEKLGSQVAQNAYQRIISEFPDQIEVVNEARARMAELIAKKPSEPSLTHIYSRDGDNFYLEAQSLSPDGTKLLGIDISTGQNVAYKDLTTGKFVNITKFDWMSKGHGYTYNPVWSPNGKEVAFNFCGFHTGVWELRVADLTGKSRTIFRGESNGKDKIYPCGWFPDGDAILAIYITSDKHVQLGVIPVEGGDFKLLYEPDVPVDANFQPDAGNYFKVDLSPNGKCVVFHIAKGEDMDLYILDIASKTVKILADSPAGEFQPLWSPDGKTIAFMSNKMGNRALWGISVDLDGNPRGQPFLINNSMDGARLSNWTVHGIAYSAWLSMRDIYTIPVDPQTGAPMGKPKQLDFRPTGKNKSPIYSPDGKYIAFVMNPQKDSPGLKIVIYPVSGGEARIFDIPSKNFYVALTDLRWLPDGSGISFCNETSDETPGWKPGMRPYRFFHLDLNTEEWRTMDLGGEVVNKSEWRGDGQGFFYTRILETGESNVVERDIQTGNERILSEIRPGLQNLKCSRDYTKLAFSTYTIGTEIIDTKTGEKIKEFKRFYISAWSPDGRNIMAAGLENSYHVISLADGTSKEYDLSEYLPKGDRFLFDWSPLGNQVAFSFMFSKFDAYIMQVVIPAEKK